jgi:hypothetical protein
MRQSRNTLTRLASPRTSATQLRVPVTAEQLRDLGDRARAAGLAVAAYARRILWPGCDDDAQAPPKMTGDAKKS